MCPEAINPLPKSNISKNATKSDKIFIFFISEENCIETADTYAKCMAALALSYKDFPGIDFES